MNLVNVFAIPDIKSSAKLITKVQFGAPNIDAFEYLSRKIALSV